MSRPKAKCLQDSGVLMDGDALYGRGGRSVNTSRNQHTIATPCEVHGRGYWSGKQVRVVMNPAPVDTGICLVRSDLADAPSCSANVWHRQDASLRTNLVKGEARFQLVEHLMAALFGLEIDNCLVEIDAEELPGLDGSSGPFVDALRSAGLIIQSQIKSRFVVRDRIVVKSEKGWIEATPSQDNQSTYEYRLSFDGPSTIKDQTYSIELSPHRFIREVAAARTFVTEDQASELRNQGVASHVTNKDLLVIGSTGPIGNKYRYPDECARHKVLDLIGDLALARLDLVGKFVSYRGGHNLNGQLAQRIAELAATQIPLTQSAELERKVA